MVVVIVGLKSKPHLKTCHALNNLMQLELLLSQIIDYFAAGMICHASVIHRFYKDKTKHFHNIWKIQEVTKCALMQNLLQKKGKQFNIQ